jgi:beta-glucanase (GH16 family)
LQFVSVITLMIVSGVFSSCEKKEAVVPEKIGDWTLVWHDEFETDGLPDKEKWNYDTGSHGWGNGELQNYLMDDPRTAVVKKGRLHITALREGKRRWSSARLVTRKKADWLYGRFEVRAKLPTGIGTWPAIWMLPVKDKYGDWPKSGEIDIMEHVGFDPDIVHTSLHTYSYNHRKGTQITRAELLEGATKDYHTYICEWEPEQIRFLIDDNEFLVFANEHNTFAEWPFDTPFYLILNVAIGGGWGGHMGIDKEMKKAVMEIDYVRVYQKL